MEEYKKILKANGITGRDMAGMLGLSESSYWSMLSRGIKRGTPRWVRAFMVGYELRRKAENRKDEQVEVVSFEGGGWYLVEVDGKLRFEKKSDPEGL